MQTDALEAIQIVMQTPEPGVSDSSNAWLILHNA